jgi:isoleucyl-tRNA synthetase
MRRTPEVADVWLDSGSMPFAQWHYPFENHEKVEREVPADFIAEAVDQTRGWFYTLLAVAVLYKGKPAYRSCVSTDLVLDAKGKKMSKSRGNIVVPDDVIAKYGADVVRWHLLTSRPLWLPLRFDEKDLEDARNRFFGTLASTYQFFAMYANVDGYADAEPPADWRPSDLFDRWLLSRLDRLVSDVAVDVAAYETSRAGRRIVDFVVEDLSNWYVRRNRRRFWKGALTDGKRDGYRALHAALATVARLVAPIAPFLSDALHRALSPRAKGTAASVHLAAWPAPVPGRRDPALEEEMEALRTVVSLGHAARNRAGIKVRRPLSRLTTGHVEARVVDFLKANQAVVLDELNVKELKLVRGFEASAAMRASLSKKEAAPRLGARTKPAEDAVAALSEPAAADLAARLARDGKASLALPTGESVELVDGDVRFVPKDVEGAASEYAHGILVRLDTAVTPALEAEGVAREFLHALQGRRKDRGLEVTDRVRVAWRAQGDLAAAVRAHARWIAEELLATSFAESPDLPEAPGDRVDVDGAAAWVSMEVAGA